MSFSWGTDPSVHRHDWNNWSAWGFKDANCIQTRTRYCKDAINCGHVQDETKTNHKFERETVDGVVTQKCFDLSLIHISEPTRLGMISYAVFCLKKKKRITQTRSRQA